MEYIGKFSTQQLQMLLEKMVEKGYKEGRIKANDIVCDIQIELLSILEMGRESNDSANGDR